MGANYSITTEGEEALTTAVETVLQLTGSTQAKAKLWGWGVGFDGVSSTAEPVRVRLLRQSTAGTGTAATEMKFDPDEPSALLSGVHSFTVEPTASDVLWEGHVHPQGGRVDVMYPFGREVIINASNTARIGIDVLAPAAVNVTAYMNWEE